MQENTLSRQAAAIQAAARNARLNRLDPKAVEALDGTIFALLHKGADAQDLKDAVVETIDFFAAAVPSESEGEPTTRAEFLYEIRTRGF